MQLELLVRPIYFHDPQMAVTEILPIGNCKETGDMTIQYSSCLVRVAKIPMRGRGCANFVEPSDEELSVFFSKSAQKFQHSHVDEQPVFQSSAGSGINSRRAFNSSIVNQRDGSGSSNIADILRMWSARSASLKPMRKATSSLRDCASSAAAVSFSVSRLMLSLRHILGLRAIPAFPSR